MHQTTSPSRRAWKRRATSLLLALVMILGLVPGLPALESEASAHWADTYLSQLVEWGFIRADQANYPDRALTRADFMAITNRAYGYHEVGETPFEDIAENDWFYDDVGIAYTAKYIKGTSPTTASPNSPLTRETAATILGRNMMLQESAGELLDFTDARQISTWARGTVKSSLEHYLVSGYSDGTFRPQRNVSWGEMAAMLTNLVGTPLQEPGDYSLGGTFGNVTITSPGVTLRDTVVSGDLYISGGVGLGDVVLENVTVLGRIIASGTGSSEGGEDSILLRNVIADELLVANLQGNNVSVRADGVTEIGRTTVRTNAYIEDNTPDGLGLHYISVEGESYPEGEEPDDWEPIQVTLAGRIEEVVNRTPQSTIHVGRGTVAKLTVDEAATESLVIIDRGAVVNELNLDTTTEVTGEGDIGKLVVNAPDCVVEMLPDQIEIRPGITAEIAGEEMDTVAAEESSQDPMILAGYPQAQDIIPTGLDAVFSTNKAGTIYWAVSAITDGSVGEEDLIKPPSYGSIAVKNGSLGVAKGNEETTAKITGLTPGGSYYLSAVLVDARGKHSAVKVISFTTPDNTTPAFCSGYPYMSKVSRTDSVVVVMPNKDCKLYYALLPEGGTAPTENELKTASVSGALGYGVRDVTKNVEDAFRVNDVILEEQTTYVLYLWLVDADGVNKGKVTSLKFTTDDETPPEFIVDPTPNKIQATSVSLTFRLNENGTVYWVAVPAGTVYPKPEPGTEDEYAPPNSMYGKLQIASGMNIGSDGKFGKVTAKENVDGTITVSGLKPESAYDFYYVAKDNAGSDRNYSEVWKKITINTLDVNGPKFTQSFSRTSGSDKTVDPLSTTDIYLDVSENVRYTGKDGGTGFLELYQNVKNSTGDAKKRAINILAANLYGAIRLHKVSIQDNSEETVLETHNTGDAFSEKMTIDYTQATVEARSAGGIRITFPASGLHLENGGQYYFTIGEVTDTSNNQNEISPDPVNFWENAATGTANGHNVPPFVVEFAAVNLSSPGVGAGDGPIERDNSGKLMRADGTVNSDYKQTRIDVSFRMTPTSTSTVSDSISYDVLLWSDSIVNYKLYYRVLDESGERIDKDGVYPSLTFTDDPDEKPTPKEDYLLPQRTGCKGNDTVDQNGWIYLGASGDVNPDSGSWSGKSVNGFFNNCTSTNFPQLNHLNENLRYEFVITLDKFKGNDQYETWNGEVKFRVNVAAGQSNNLDNLAGNPTVLWETYKKLGMSGGARSIGRWNNAQNQLVDTQELSRFFTDSSLPQFHNGAPIFENITSTTVDMWLTLDNPGTVYYVIGKASSGPNGTPEITTTRYVLKEDKDAVAADKTLSIQQVGNNQNQMYVKLDSPNRPQDDGNLAGMPNWMKGTDKTYDDTDWTGVTDNPGLSNQLISPINQNIFSPDSWSSGANAIKGSVRSEAFRSEPKTIEGLEPNTDYFAYFVIKGEADDLSHVYIYHFKTNKSAKPKIGINPISDGSVDLWTDIPATMAYVLFTVDDAKSDKLSILNRKFSEVVDNTGDYVEAGKGIPNCWKTITEGGVTRDFTVLDALRTTYSYTDISATDRNDNSIFIPKSADGQTAPYEGGYSVFDIYANGAIRRAVDELIRNNLNNNGANRIDFGTGINSPGGGEENGRFNQPLKDVIEGNKYVIITVALSPNRGEDQENAAEYELESFKAYYNVEKSAGAAPNLTERTNGKPEPNKTTGAYDGEISLVFDKNLYDTDTPPKPLTTGGLSGIDKLFDKGTGITVSGTSTATATVPAPGFRIKITGMKIGDSITLYPSPPLFGNASGANPDETLTISLEKYTEVEESTGDTVTYVRYVVVWSEPDYKRLELAGTEIDRVSAAAPTITIAQTGGTAVYNSGTKSLPMTLGTPPQTATLRATINNGTDSKITWKWEAADSSVITISNSSNAQTNITAKATGMTLLTVTATVNGRAITETVSVVVTAAAAGTYDNRVSPDSPPTLRVDPFMVTIPANSSTTVAATCSSNNAIIKWTSANPKVATVSDGGRITGKGIGTTIVSATATVGTKTVSADVTVTVTGKVTGLTSTSLKSSTWTPSTDSLTLTRGSGVPSAVFTANTSASMVGAKPSVSVTNSSGKDASSYVSCIVNNNGSITVMPGTASASASDKFTVTVGLVTSDGKTNLTSGGGTYTFTVQIKGNDANVNIASRKTSK